MMFKQWAPLAIGLMLAGVAYGDTVTVTNISGGSISEHDPDSRAQGHYYALVGYGKYGWSRRPVMKFDMSQFPAANVSSITGVTLRTYVPDIVPTSKQTAPLGFTVYAITQAWVSGEASSTWTSLKDKCNTAKPFGAGKQVFKGNVQTVDIVLNNDGVEMVKSWITSPATNFGFMIISDGGFDTPDSTIGSEANLPALIIQTSANP